MFLVLALPSPSRSLTPCAGLSATLSSACAALALAVLRLLPAVAAVSVMAVPLASLSLAFALVSGMFTLKLLKAQKIQQAEAELFQAQLSLGLHCIGSLKEHYTQ